MWKAGILPCRAAEGHASTAAGSRDSRNARPGRPSEQVVDLAVAKLIRRLGIKQVVDAGRAAAERGFGDFGDLEAGNPASRLARLLLHSLRVLQMAGIVIGDAHLRGCRGAWGARSQRNSLISLHFAEKAAARAAHSGSSRSR